MNIRSNFLFIFKLGLLATPCTFCITTLSAQTIQPQDTSAIYNDPKQPVEARVQDLLKRMTLDEKLSLVHANSKFTTAAIPRLGIPMIWMSDGPHGVRRNVGPDTWNNAKPDDDMSDSATWMPCGLALAATWDTAMARAYGDEIGDEARARGKDIMLGPGVNIMRTPLNGRNFEYDGEDPYLASRIAVNYIQGVMAHDVSSCVKHFAANNQETNRATVDVEMDDRTLYEIYLPAFKAAVQEGGALAIMGSYNALRGVYNCENDLLLNKILKGEWGFKGLVMSDWAGVHDTGEAVLGGLDLEMGTNVQPQDAYGKFYLADAYKEGLQNGTYPMSTLDEKAGRVLYVMFSLHMFDNDRPAGTLNTKEHENTARKVAEESMVLLKNDKSTLPFDAAKLKTVAVIGDFATVKNAGNGLSTAIKTPYEITPLEGIKNRLGDKVNVIYAQGYAPIRPQGFGRGRGAGGGRGGQTAPQADTTALADEAIAAAKKADAVIFVAGIGFGRGLEGEGNDRADMRLPGTQNELIQSVVAANPNTVVVLATGGAVEMDPWLDTTPAVLQAWISGMEGGNALARILFGDVNPSGKLPFTFPKKLSDTPPAAFGEEALSLVQNAMETYKEGIYVGYRWYDTKKIDPLFPFGYGLSYTSFAYSNFKLVPGTGSGAKDAIVTVQFDVANTGSREGGEVPQIYVHQDKPSLDRPDKELKGFTKVFLKPGEKQTLTIPLDQSSFAYYDPAKKGWLAEAGGFKILVGSSSRDIRLQGDYALATTSLQ